jgi:hypothetical protein
VDYYLDRPTNDFSALKMEVVCSSETSVHADSLKRYFLYINDLSLMKRSVMREFVLMPKN